MNLCENHDDSHFMQVLVIEMQNGLVKQMRHQLGNFRNWLR